MNIANLTTGLMKWAADVLGDGVPVIPAFSNKPAPKVAYITLEVKTWTRVGEDAVGAPDDEGVAQILGVREFTAYFQGVGAGAVQLLSNLRDSLQKESVRDLLAGDGIVYVTAEDVVVLTNLIEATDVERGAFDTRFRTDSSIEDNVGVIEKTEGTATYSRYQGDPTPLSRSFSIGE